MRQRHSAVGIDIGKGAVKLVQLRRKGDSFELVAAATLKRDFPNDGEGSEARAGFIREMKKVLAVRKFAAGKAVVSLAASDVDIRLLTLAVDDKDVATKVRWEAESYLGYDAANAIIDQVVLGEAKSAGERRLEVLAAAVEKGRMLSSLEVLSGAGLVPEAVEIAPLALCRLLYRLENETDEAVAAVDIGAASTHAVIMNNRELRMTRTIDIGGDAFTEAIRAALEISPDEAEVLKCQHGIGAADEGGGGGEEAAEGDESRKIGRIIRDILRDKVNVLELELQKLFRYFSAQSQGRTVERVLLVGGGAALGQVDARLAARLNTRVEVGNPLSRLTGGRVELREGNEGSYAVAAGLALREV